MTAATCAEDWDYMTAQEPPPPGVPLEYAAAWYCWHGLTIVPLVGKNPSAYGDDWWARAIDDPFEALQVFSDSRYTNIGWAQGYGTIAYDVDHADKLNDQMRSVIRTGARNPTREGRGHRIFGTDERWSASTSRCPVEGWGEIRAHGGQIVIWGPHPDDPSCHYAYDPRQEVPPAPPELIGWLTPRREYEGTATDDEVRAFLDGHTESDRPALMQVVFSKADERIDNGESIHDTTAKYVVPWLLREVRAGLYSGAQAEQALREWWEAHWDARDGVLADRNGVRQRTKPGPKELAGILKWALARAMEESDEDIARLRDKFTDGTDSTARASGPDSPAGERERRRIVLTPASAIAPRRVRWAWDGRWAVGSFGLLGGREGLGKSSVTADVTASITRGTLPGEYQGEPRAVLICATEDSWAHTIVPRLIAAGADLDLVYRIDVMSADNIEVGLSLPMDTHQIEQAVEQTGAVLLILDPLLSRLSGTLDTHKDAEVRRALEPLTAVADHCNLFVLGLIHLNKGGGTSEILDRLMGSRAFTAVARSVSVVIADPDDETERTRIFGTPKSNLGRSDLPSLSFTVDGHQVDTDDGPTTVGKIVWTGETATTIRDAMTRSAEDSTVRTATSEAVEWLQEYMEMFGPTVASKMVKTAARSAGHSDKTLSKARTRLGLLSVPRPGTFPRETDWTEPSNGPVEPVEPSVPRGEE